MAECLTFEMVEGVLTQNEPPGFILPVISGIINTDAGMSGIDRHISAFFNPYSIRMQQAFIIKGAVNPEIPG